MEQTLTPQEVTALAEQLRDSRRDLLFTNLANKKAVAKECRLRRIPVRSRTSHGSLLDPRYTVEGRSQPDRGLANDYKHFHAKLYVLECDRTRW
jgi:hypothetical protein